MKATQVTQLTALKTTLIAKRIPLIHSLLGIIILCYLLKLSAIFFNTTAVNIDHAPALINAQAIAPIPHLSELHLFGIYEVNDTAMLPLAQLGLTLQGILYAPEAVNSQAIIAAATGTAKTYRLGDTINGAIIKQILPNNVVFETGGTLARLPLIRPELTLTKAT